MKAEQILNPALRLAISRMQEDNSLEMQNRMVAEAINARYLVPCDMVMKPGTEHETKRTVANMNTKIQMAQMEDGKKFVLAFTDMDEVKSWKNDDAQNVLILGFDDLAGLALNPRTGAAGFIVNIESSHVLFRNHIIEMILTNRDKAIEEGKLRPVSSKELEELRRMQKASEAATEEEDTDNKED